MMSVERRTIGAAFWIVVAIAILVAAVFLARRQQEASLPLHERVAKAYPVQGIDVSRHQGPIDWRAVRQSGIRFAWIKATEGGDHLDAGFRRNWTLAWAAGVRRGAYHFVYWCRRAEDQAAWFVANVPDDPDALPPVLDVEWNPSSRTCPQKVPRDAALAMMKVILAAMEKTYGKVPIIYAPRDFFRDVMDDDLKAYPLWVRNVDDLEADGYDERPWVIWQHAETGRVPGIAGDVDLDAFHGDLPQWRRWLATGRF